MLLSHLLATGESVNPNENLTKKSPGARKPNGHIWKLIARQVSRKSLEWTPWARYLDMDEFNKQNASTSNGLALREGVLKVRNKYEEFTVGPASTQNAKKNLIS